MDNTDLQIKEVGGEFTPKNTPFFQGALFAKGQEKTGRKVSRFVWYENGQVVSFVQLFLFNIRGFKVWYAPRGIVGKYYKEMLDQLKTKLKGSFIRIENVPGKNISHKLFTGSFMQPDTEWIVSLKENRVFSKSCMQSLKKAKEGGIQVTFHTDNLEELIGLFLEKMKAMANRKGVQHIISHTKKYYTEMIREIGATKQGAVVLARDKEGEVSSIAVFGISSKEAVFLYGASDDGKNQQSSYLLHKEAMDYFAAKGLEEYNFGAVNYEGRHPNWEGLLIFKRKFGGFVRVHSATDVVLNRFQYALYRFLKVFSLLFRRELGQ